MCKRLLKGKATGHCGISYHIFKFLKLFLLIKKKEKKTRPSNSLSTWKLLKGYSVYNIVFNMYIITIMMIMIIIMFHCVCHDDYRVLRDHRMTFATSAGQ